MSAIAESFVAFAQPLIDQTDGSQEQVQKAFTIAQFCFNLAMTPEAERDKFIKEVRPSLEMDDATFEDFRQSVLLTMVRRHEEMFPLLHELRSPAQAPGGLLTWEALSRVEPTPAKKYPGTDRYAPCPCGSGEKYKFCCGKRRR
jgi:uncharacterized protein YecA (UPF0149 family)